MTLSEDTVIEAGLKIGMALDEKARVQMIDAAANASGQNADCIKIIPQKNE